MKFILSIAMLFITLGAIRAEDDKAIIKRVNSQNAAIQSFVADVEVILQRRAVTFSSTGKVFFKKPMNYRMQTVSDTKHVMGGDMGSNDNLFWFYIRRIDADTLFYSQYSNLANTNLPNSLHPLWMMDLLGLNSIETKGAYVSNQNNMIFVRNNKTNTQQVPIAVWTIVDPSRPAITGCQFVDASRRTLASHTISSFFKTNTGAFLPQISETHWTGEQVRITIKFKNPKVNVAIDPKVFQMPRYNLKSIDIGRQRVDFDRLERR